MRFKLKRTPNNSEPIVEGLDEDNSTIGQNDHGHKAPGDNEISETTADFSVLEEPEPSMVSQDEPVLEFVEVSKTFPGPAPVEALKSCSFSMSKNDFLTITGPSGSGKSTLLNLAGLLDRPTKGVVRINGVDTSDLKESQRTNIRGGWLGFVFQSFHLMERRTVLDNVALTGLYQNIPLAQRQSNAEAAIEKVGLSHRIDSPAKVLSGGERQRVAIARAIAGSPLLLLCDEPTGNLDSANSAAIVDLLGELNSTGIGVIIITHDPDIAITGRSRLSVLDGVVTREA